MSQPRSEFKKLLDVVATAGSVDGVTVTVYGQEPSNTGMRYPAIKYTKDQESVDRADNIPYNIIDGYEVMVIESDPNTPIAKMVRELPMCSFNRYYVVTNLHHSVYTIYF